MPRNYLSFILCSVQSNLGKVISLEAINKLLMPGMNMKRRNDGRWKENSSKSECLSLLEPFSVIFFHPVKMTCFRAHLSNM